MTSLRSQMSRKRLVRNVQTFGVPALLGVAVGIFGFFLLDDSAATPAPTEISDARPRVQRALAPPPQQPRAVGRRETMVHQGPYRNCAAARADNADPVYAGDPGYGPHLDGDNDGIGCEPYRR